MEIVRKYWPLVVAAVAVIGGAFTLRADVEQHTRELHELREHHAEELRDIREQADTSNLRLVERLQTIDQRLSRMEGQLTTIANGGGS